MAIPFVILDLGVPRRLRFGMGAMVEFEKITGTKLMDLGDNMSIDTCAKILWVMLKQDEPELTFSDTCRLIDDHANSINEVLEAVKNAIEAAFKTGKDQKNV